jgi:hypothetical protein
MTDTRTASRYRLMIEAGRDDAYIARRMGVKEKTVRNWRGKLSAQSHAPHRFNGPPRYRAVFEEGRSNAEIAALFKVREQQVQRMRRKLGFAPERPRVVLTYAKYGRPVTEAYNRGMTYREIAVELFGEANKSNMRAICRMLAQGRREGKVTRPKAPSARRFTEEELALAKRLLEDGASYKEVQRTLGRGIKGADTLSRKFPGMGWTAGMGKGYAVMKAQLDAL